jgi:hypothetical protein
MQTVTRFEVQPKFGCGAEGLCELNRCFRCDLFNPLNDLVDRLMGASDDLSKVPLGPSALLELVTEAFPGSVGCFDCIEGIILPRVKLSMLLFTLRVNRNLSKCRCKDFSAIPDTQLKRRSKILEGSWMPVRNSVIASRAGSTPTSIMTTPILLLNNSGINCRSWGELNPIF